MTLWGEVGGGVTWRLLESGPKRGHVLVYSVLFRYVRLQLLVWPAMLCTIV